MGLTMKVAEFVTGATLEDFPPAAVDAARAGILDCVGVALAGSREPLADILSDFVRESDSGSQATVWGRGSRASAPGAALLNGSMGHALDYDDISRLLKGHPSAVLTPAAVAAGEAVNATGAEVLVAYTVGFEVASALAAGLGHAYADDLGWHPTAPAGTLGAAAAASRLLRLDQAQAAMALSLAASHAAGLRENFGSMTKPYHAGNAARSGVVAATLVQRGFTSSTTGLEGRFGFLRAFSGARGFDPDVVAERLGKELALVEHGVEIKKYPCCGSAHLPLDAVFAILKQRNIRPEEVEEVQVRVDFDPPRSLIHYNPQTGLEGKFSLQYCLAAALLDRKVGLGTFTDEMVRRPQAQAMFPKVRMVRHDGYAGQPSWVEGFNQVDIHLKGGQVLSHKALRPKGGGIWGVTQAELRAKYRDCASTALAPDEVEASLRALEHIEELPAISQLTTLLAGTPPR